MTQPSPPLIPFLPPEAHEPVFTNLPVVTEHITSLRHDLHRHPELAFCENYTSALITRELTRLGIPHQTGYAGGTGVVALIQGTQPTTNPTKCVALRADIDALPILEATGLPYASLIPGCMHACGHDGHTTILLGTAAQLQAHREQFSGTVKLLFQPAEENGSGAARMVHDGVLENPKVDAIFGLHGWPSLKVGTVATKPGPLLASVDALNIKITGRGCHAAKPQQGVDPILCAAAMIQALQQIIARETEPGEAAVLTISQIHSGTSYNIIPETADLNGTIRALSEERRQSVLDSVKRIAHGVAAAHNCTAHVEFYGYTPSTINPPEMADFVKQIAQQTLGRTHYIPVGQATMGGEDFSFYLQKIPGCFFFLGVQPADRDSYPMLHNPAFDFTDAALPVGIRMMSSLALAYLAR